jgi:hypothetical protein
MKTSSLLTLLIFLIACSPKRSYDTSTPEKFVTALGLVNSHPQDENPVPFFYDKLSSEKITQYDEASFKAKNAFTKFKNKLANTFPDKVVSVTETSIKVMSGEEDYQTESFSLSAYSVSSQMRERNASDYLYVSESAPNSSGVITLKLKIKDEDVEIELKKESGHYVMFLDNENIEMMERMTKFLLASDGLFSNCAMEIENGLLTEENFNEKIFDWSFAHISNFMDYEE